MITPELKDKVLNNLLSHNDVTYTFNIIQLAALIYKVTLV